MRSTQATTESLSNGYPTFAAAGLSKLYSKVLSQPPPKSDAISTRNSPAPHKALSELDRDFIEKPGEGYATSNCEPPPFDMVSAGSPNIDIADKLRSQQAAE